MANKIEAEVREIIKAHVNKDIPIEKLDTGIELEKFGIHSLNYIKILAAVETKYDIEFGDEELLKGAFKTLGALIEYIEEMVMKG